MNAANRIFQCPTPGCLRLTLESHVQCVECSRGKRPRDETWGETVARLKKAILKAAAEREARGIRSWSREDKFDV